VTIVGRNKTVKNLEGPKAAFATALRKTRIKAGTPTYTLMATVTECSSSWLSEADRGEKFPTWRCTFAYLRGCGLTEKVIYLQWKMKWERAKKAIDRKAEADRCTAAVTKAGS
jgi:hypothetical protein